MYDSRCHRHPANPVPTRPIAGGLKRQQWWYRSATGGVDTHRGPNQIDGVNTLEFQLNVCVRVREEKE